MIYHNSYLYLEQKKKTYKTKHDIIITITEYINKEYQSEKTITQGKIEQNHYRKKDKNN